MLAPKVIVMCVALAGVLPTEVAQGARQIAVVVIAPSVDDPGVLAAREALAFWNRTLSDLGIPLQMKELRVEIASLLNNAADKYTRQMDALTNEKDEPAVPPELKELHDNGGDLVIFLSGDQAHISFGGTYGTPGTFPGFVAMRSARIFPLNLPNVARNTTAHEIGHALGLSHNADRSNLMCGRPAECRPALFESREMRFFPLTEDDRSTLKRLHGRPDI